MDQVSLMKSLLLLNILLGLCLGAQITMLPNQLYYATSGDGSSYFIPGVASGSTSLQIDAWRTSAFSGTSSKQPVLQLAVTPSSWPRETSPGKYYESFPQNRTYDIRVSSSNIFSDPFTYTIRYCLSGFCTSTCPYNYGYCSNNGNCDTNGFCHCDKVDNQTWTSDSSVCSTVSDLWKKLIGLWIALIIVGSLLVVGIPCIICICCCGVCGAVAAEASSLNTPTLKTTVYYKT
eukprot:TRINITY_DN1724_c0_g1_i1.p1 TRINITY_DN1724_c0_g1~~TRINITY_DN1724_c0_g1_i1.p1  ORF type:complete len:233 (+),score=36.49 TRINITY_DN1724_c0_g1_i1:20-718(+)